MRTTDMTSPLCVCFIHFVKVMYSNHWSHCWSLLVDHANGLKRIADSERENWCAEAKHRDKCRLKADLYRRSTKQWSDNCPENTCNPRSHIKQYGYTESAPQ